MSWTQRRLPKMSLLAGRGQRLFRASLLLLGKQYVNSLGHFVVVYVGQHGCALRPAYLPAGLVAGANAVTCPTREYGFVCPYHVSSVSETGGNRQKQRRRMPIVNFLQPCHATPPLFTFR